MKMKLVLLVAAMTALTAACSPDYDDDDYERSKKTAMQKSYRTEAECRREFSQAGDCRRDASGYYMSPIFYPWGAVYHSNGTTSYNNRVPTSGYRAAPSHVQQSMASSRAVNFSKAPSYSGTVRGGFGGSARASSSSSFGG